MKPEISIVVPVYNNATCLEELVRRLAVVLSDDGIQRYEVIFVDDGSTDDSRGVLKRLCAHDRRLKLLGLSRNFGQQAAITAGFDCAAGEAVVVIDADLQDPPEVVHDFLRHWREGYDVVYGVRESRAGDSLLKRSTAAVFYRMLRSLSAADIQLDAGEFRLISRRVLLALTRMRERHRFLRGLISWMGYRQIAVRYRRAPRWAGESQYSFAKLATLALDAVFSFSELPLRLAAFVGFAGTALSLCYLGFALAFKLIWDVPLQGWASLLTVIVFFGSLQLMVLGLIGEYIARISRETKGRPLYLVDESVGVAGEGGGESHGF